MMVVNSRLCIRTLKQLLNGRKNPIRKDDERMSGLNRYHQKRKDSLIKSIQKASDKAAQSWMYLTANKDVPPEELADMALAQIHLDIALERLGVSLMSE